MHAQHFYQVVNLAVVKLYVNILTLCTGENCNYLLTPMTRISAKRVSAELVYPFAVSDKQTSTWYSLLVTTLNKTAQLIYIAIDFYYKSGFENYKT